MTPEQVASELGVTATAAAAFGSAGLLGFVKDGKVDRARVLHFKQYGTQWDDSLGVRDAPYNSMPTPDGWEDTPPGFPGVIRIEPAPVRDVVDHSWLAHFYLRPNRFFFPDPMASAPIGPLPIRLRTTAVCQSEDFQVSLCPHPDGSLALAATSGELIEGVDPLHVANDRIAPLLDQLSYEYDHPIHVCQRLWIGVPSGMIMTEFTRRPQEVEVRPADLKTRGPLVEAVSLFREGLIAQTPFHQFLCFWRVRENVVKHRTAWCRTTGSRVEKINPERFPHAPAFLSFAGRPFESAKKDLERAYRVAIAHGGVSDGTPRILSRSQDLTSVARHVPIVRFVARTLIRNFEIALDGGDGPDT